MKLSQEIKLSGSRWARLVGVSPRMAQRWISGETPTPADAILRVVEAMDEVAEGDRPRVAWMLLRKLAGRDACAGVGRPVSVHPESEGAKPRPHCGVSVVVSAQALLDLLDLLGGSA